MSSLKHVFDTNYEKNCKSARQRHTTPCPIPWNEKKLDIACSRKVPKSNHFDAFLLLRIGYFGTTDSVELNVAFFDIFKKSETLNFPVRTHF